MAGADFEDLIRYQNMLAQQVARQAKTDRKIRFLHLAADLGGAARKRIQTAALIHEAELAGYTESEAYAVLDELERDGLLTQAGDGYVKAA